MICKVKGKLKLLITENSLTVAFCFCFFSFFLLQNQMACQGIEDNVY